MNEHNQHNDAWSDNSGQGFSQPQGETPPPPPEWDDTRYDSFDSGEPRPSWELREEIGWVQAGLSSLKEILLDPETTFRRMPLAGGIGGPLLFLVIFGFIGAAGSTLWSILWNMLLAPVQMAGQRGGPNQELAFLTSTFGNVFVQLVLLFISPIMIVVSTFFYAGVYHLLLMLFSAATREFEATMRCVCYASGAVMILNVIPWFCGSFLLVFVWSIVCLTIALREAHQTSTMKAFSVVMLPMLFCCCVAFFLAMFIGIGVVGIISAS